MNHEESSDLEITPMSNGPSDGSRAVWLFGVALLIASAAGFILFEGFGSAGESSSFPTLPPHSSLPSDAKCASMVVPSPENRPGNERFNHTTPTPSELDSFHAALNSNTNGPATDFDRVDGAYTGSTQMILEWAACKWGIDENVVFAQAWTESKWRQGGSEVADGGGDKRANRAECVRNGFAALWNYGCAGCCFQSWGILQTKVYYAPQTWPMIKDSTAFNADYRYAEERACMNGDFAHYFASAAQQPNTYSEDIASGDLSRILWGCTGMHFSGSWYDAPARRYIEETKTYLLTRPWERLRVDQR